MLSNNRERISSLKDADENIHTGDQVEILVMNRSDIGFNVVINNTYRGVLHDSDILGKLDRKNSIRAYIKNIREDKKIDVVLQKPGYGKVQELEDIIIERIEKNGGVLNLSDKSSPGDIYSLFKVSKKTFKKALGALYKKKIINIEDERIILKG